MTTEQILITLLSLLTGGIGWFSRELYEAVSRLREDLQKLEIKISADYVRYDRLQDAIKPIMSALDEIKQALNHKQDKP